MASKATPGEPLSESRKKLAESLGITFMGTAPSALRMRHAIGRAPVAMAAPAIEAAMAAQKEEKDFEFKPSQPQLVESAQALPETAEQAQEDPDKYMTEFYDTLSDSELQGYIDRDNDPIAKQVMGQRKKMGAQELGKQAVEREIVPRIAPQKTEQPTGEEDKEVQNLVKRTGMSLAAATGLLKQRRQGVANEGTTPTPKKQKNPFAERVKNLPSNMGDFDG
jgi:predicted Zn-dependent protease